MILTTCCSTSEQTTLLPPTCTSIGLLRILRASASIALGKVAENMTVCRSGLTLSTMRITWFKRRFPVSAVIELHTQTSLKLGVSALQRLRNVCSVSSWDLDAGIGRQAKLAG